MRTVATLGLLLATTGLAQEPKPDPIADQLRKDKEEYVDAVGKAKAELLKAFDKHFEAVKNNKALKIEAQLAQLEKIEAEKKAFDESGVPPTLPALKVPLSDYRFAVKKADGACKTAFEKAAKAYRDANDVKAAVAALEEMKEFLAQSPSGGGAPVVIASALSPTVLAPARGAAVEKARIVTAEYVKGDQSQLWKTVPAADGYVYIENLKSGLVVTVSSNFNGAEAHLEKRKDGADGQLWKLTPVAQPKDAVKIVGKAGGRLLAVDNAAKGPGHRLLLWDDNGGDGASAKFGFFPPK